MVYQLSLAGYRLRKRPKWQSEGEDGAPAEAPVEMDRDLVARRLRLPVLAIRPAVPLLSSPARKRKVASAGAGSATPQT